MHHTRRRNNPENHEFYFHTQFIYESFQYYRTIYAKVFQMVSFFDVYRQTVGFLISNRTLFHFA